MKAHQGNQKKQNDFHRTPVLLFFVKLTIFLLLAAVHPAYAQYHTGAMANGAGGAGRANIDRGVETLLNPATIAHAKGYTTSLIYENGATWDDSESNSIGVALTDNTEEVFLPASIIYLTKNKKYINSNDLEETYLNVSLGNFVYKQFSLGVSAIYLSGKETGGNDYDQTDMVLGALFNPNPDFALGVVRYHFLKDKEENPVLSRLYDTWAVGSHYIFTDFTRVRFDLLYQAEANVDKKMIAKYGIETFVGDFNIIRLGGENNNLEDNAYFSIGWTFNGPKLKLDYSFRKNVKASNEALHGVDMRIAF